MKTNRRNFLSAGLLSLAVGEPRSVLPRRGPGVAFSEADYARLDDALAKPVLKKELSRDPVLIDKVELLRYQNKFVCRVRSSDGAVGYSAGNSAQLKSLYPVFVNRLQPFFYGKDARNLEQLLEEVYVYGSNYKLQGLALWIPLATLEFAILDMLGQIAGKSMGELIGTIHNPKVAVYSANGDRYISVDETLRRIAKQVEESKARAIKLKVGGRMSAPETPPGRTEALIAAVRKAYGDDMVLYADSNGSYTVKEAIRIGRILEEYNYAFFEEPVPFDWYEETRAVAQALTIPIAGGEQEPSMRNFRWLIGNDALSIVQPDLFYFGGMIRSMRVARMAQAIGKVCTPHISGDDLGYLYMMHFISAIPNAGPYHEFKGFADLPVVCSTSSLGSEDGLFKVPTGPGLGVEIDPDYLAKHKVVD